jgi:hypothetical protein
MAGIPTFEPPATGTDFFQTNYSGGIQGTLETGSNTYAPQYDSSAPSFEDEPPLLEELGINFSHIFQKTLAVLTPFRKMDSSLHINDDDLAGPLVFASLFASFLLLVRFEKPANLHFFDRYLAASTGSEILFTDIMMLITSYLTI